MDTSQDDGRRSHRSIPQQGQAHHTPYAKGTHMVNHRDGARDQMAMLFTEDMALQIMNIGKQSRLVEQQERILQDVEREILIAKVSICSLQSSLEPLENEEEKRGMQEEIEGYEETVRKSSASRDNINSELEWRKSDEKMSRKRFQHQMEYILAQSGLLDLQSLEPPPIEASSQEADESYRSTTPALSEAMAAALDPGEAIRYAALEEIDSALMEYQDADEAFNFFDEFQWNERQDFKAQVLAGNIDISQEDFDHMMIGEQRQRTRDLTHATDRYKRALEQAKAVGVYTGQWDDMGPENRNKFDGFYDEEVEVAILKQTDPEVIEKWQDVVCANFHGSQDTGAQEIPDDVGNWDAKSVGMSSGFSVVDHGNVIVAEYGMYKDRISSWREHCGLLRRERLAKSQGRPSEEHCCIPCDRPSREYSE